VDFTVIRRLVAEKLRERSTYVVALIVGTLINLYGQVLVPWLRGFGDPFAALAGEFAVRPGLVLATVFIAYAFPLAVGVYSAVTARYQIR
jgi:membrane protein YqaA with SNARE-associated domain